MLLVSDAISHRTRPRRDCKCACVLALIDLMGVWDQSDGVATH